MTQVKSAEIRCIICPNGCLVTVKERPDGTYDTEGAGCKRGIEYTEQEYREPKRMLITTMRIEGGMLPVLPVRSTKELPKQRIFDAVKYVSAISIKAPVKMGTVLVPNLLKLGVDVIASRDMEKKAK
ncbi:MAG: transcriptional regulator [Promethearchaeota archaeon CR_4]|nr:MAG: transcriptional regulator [Candidatus Lokiarchaeota archaeon CR_4]